jgi:acetyl/propionyl-CoA carboxylase alpha subunit
VDTHLVPSKDAVIGTNFDNLIAKIIVTAPSWDDVLRKAKRALADTYIDGVKTSLDVLRGIVASEAFATQSCDTQWLESNLPTVLDLGKRVTTQSTQKFGSLSSSSPSNTIAAASSVIFHKGDAWSISLTPETPPGADPSKPTPSHLQLSRVLRNEFCCI